MQFLETKNKLENLVRNLKEQCALRDPDLPIVYVITPTYSRPVQEAELTRCRIFSHLKPVIIEAEFFLSRENIIHLLVR